MSLQIWLPLNGNLDNQGLSGVKPTISSPIYSNGKIGQCLLLDKQIDTTLPFANWDYVTNSCSFGCWVKVSLADLQTIANGKTFDSTNSTMGGTLLGKDSYGGVALRWKTNNLSSSKTITQVILYGHIRNTNSNSQVTNSYVLPFDTWTHVVLVINRSTQTMGMYINGKLFNEKGIGGVTGTFSTGNFLICQSSWDGGNGVSSSGKFNLNDVRVYDHALSAKEVKELAKGLVLHYRLSGPGQENLTKGNNTYERNSASTDGWFWFSGSNFNCKPSTTYTLSIDIDGTISNFHGGSASTDPAKRWASMWFYLCKTGTSTNAAGGGYDSPINLNSTNYNFRKIGPTRYAWTYTTPADARSLSIRGNTYSNGTNAIKVKFWNPKIEEGTIATPWCPKSDESIYTSLGYNNNIEYDCSGYRRNGTKSGTIAWDIDSPRYTTSYKFATGSKISTSSGFPTGTNPQFTINFWFNPPTNFTYTSYADICGLHCTTTGYPDTWCRLEACGSPAGSAWSWFRGFQPTSSNLPVENITQDTWNMITLVSDGTKMYTYTNGVNTRAMNITEWQPNGDFHLGDSAGGISGKYSDLRIYATALSAEDIKELYHSAVIIDNTGKNYAYEYFEA